MEPWPRGVPLGGIPPWRAAVRLHAVVSNHGVWPLVLCEAFQHIICQRFGKTVYFREELRKGILIYASTLVP